MMALQRSLSRKSALHLNATLFFSELQPSARRCLCVVSSNNGNKCKCWSGETREVSCKESCRRWKRPNLKFQLLGRLSSTQASWSQLIESVVQNSLKETYVAGVGGRKGDASLATVREQLNQALAARRSHEQGDLLPNVIASEICKLYSSIEDKDEKFAFFNLISSSLDVDHDGIEKAINLFKQAETRGDAAILKARERLSSSLDPAYKHLLTDIGHLEEGIKMLVNMRKDLLGLMKDKSLQTNMPQLQVFEKHLKQHLAQWFSAGFLHLERVTWQSPAAILEKIMEYEQVHPTKGWEDFKRRLNEDRRVFIFTHRLLPGEPLVILHTALGDHLRFNMEGIHLPPQSNTTPGNVTAVTFYTISSTQKGLSGIDLGNYLIKVVVQELRKEFPTLTDFGTLSPIPGFAKWFYQKLKAEPAVVVEQLAKHGFQGENISDGHSFLQWLENFKVNGNISEESNEEEAKYKQIILGLCARYLYCEKRRGFALDPVANFHLRNGAILWRLNWMADTSRRGMERSFGIMTNYKYDLSQITNNNKQYVISGEIAISDSVQNFIE